MRRPALLALVLLAAAPAFAQPADMPIPAAKTDHYPPGVKVAKLPGGAVYTDAKGRTLYGMDTRMLVRWGPDPAQYCKDACAEQWEPLLAPAGSVANVQFTRGMGGPPGAAARPAHAAPPARSAAMIQPQTAPDWTIVAGPQGPQWVYKGWHMVFVRKGDKPGSTAFDGTENMVWNTLKFVPPAPKPVAPGNVATVLVEGDYALADPYGRVLFSGECQAGCGWTPLPAGLASRGVGAWTVSRSGPPQWLYRGKPVFVAGDENKTEAPAGATILRP